MKTNVQVFNNPEFGEVRTLKEDNDVLFCASDVAKALGYARPNDAIADHCRATVKRRTPISGKMQEINFIPEGDVWRLIVHSKLPKAREVEHWIMDEVLPSIRRTGKYVTISEPAEYEYTEKTYRGTPVMTVYDFSMLTGVDRYAINYALNKNKAFAKHIDYITLKGEALAIFKIENPNVSRMVTCLNVIMQSGVIKLARLFGIKIELPSLASPTTPPVVSPNTPWESKPDILEKSFTVTIGRHNHLEKIRHEAEAIKQMTYLLDSPTGRCEASSITKMYREALQRRVKAFQYMVSDIEFKLAEISSLPR